MPFAGLSYKVKPGHEEEISRIFAPENFTRVDSPFMKDETGADVGCLVCTGLFIQDDTIVRIVQHDGGTPDDVRRHMSVQEGVHAAERELMPYLPARRDTETPEGFSAHFDRSLMTVLEHQQLDSRPAASLLALRYPVRPGCAADVATAWQSAESRLVLPDDGSVVALLLLAKDDVVVRVVQAEGPSPDAALDYLRSRPVAAATDDWLAPYRAATSSNDDLEDHVRRHRMRCVSFISAAAIG